MMPEPIESVRTTTRFTARTFDVVEECIRLATGTLARHVTVRHPGAAVILPRDDDGSLIVITQYRHSVRKSLLEFPAGTLEPGEDPLVCAKRELAEEAGQLARQWHSLGELHPAPGFCSETQYCFLATGLSPCDTHYDEDERIDITTMTSAQVAEAIRTGAMTDGKSIAIYARAKLSGLV
ncbi:MAG TPA: NUDIX hydrolase [Candidatus Entotheonella sp.]|jgi:ADP-ribose pyrophosphatase